MPIASTKPAKPRRSCAGGSRPASTLPITLPSAATNAFQGKSSTISYTFDATQRTATAK